MLKDSQRRAKNRYREKITTVRIELYPTDQDIKEFLEKQGAKATYIKNLIRKDMKNGN